MKRGRSGAIVAVTALAMAYLLVCALGLGAYVVPHFPRLARAFYPPFLEYSEVYGRGRVLGIPIGEAANEPAPSDAVVWRPCGARVPRMLGIDAELRCGTLAGDPRIHVSAFARQGIVRAVHVYTETSFLF